MLYVAKNLANHNGHIVKTLKYTMSAHELVIHVSILDLFAMSQQCEIRQQNHTLQQQCDNVKCWLEYHHLKFISKTNASILFFSILL